MMTSRSTLDSTMIRQLMCITCNNNGKPNHGRNYMVTEFHQSTLQCQLAQFFDLKNESNYEGESVIIRNVFLKCLLR